MSDINSYLKRFPLNCTNINLSNKKLTNLPNLCRFTKLTVLNCSNNQLQKLTNLPIKLTKLICDNNELVELINRSEEHTSELQSRP